MTNATARERFTALTFPLDVTSYPQATAILTDAASAYYDGNGVAIVTALSDAEYDELMREVARYEAAHDIDGVSTKVAAGASTGDVAHKAPMLSLDNVFSVEEFMAFARRTGMPVDVESSDWCVEPKMDGLAMSIRYEDGRPVQMLTRGDGRHGEDVSFALHQITNLPQDAHSTFRGLRNPFFGEVRGEVIFTRGQFAAANEARLAHGDKPFVNARNGVSGAVRGAKDRAYDLPMSFFAYDVPDAHALDAKAGEGYVKSHAAAMDRIEQMGFTTARSLLGVEPLVSVTGVVRAIESLSEPAAREALPAETDGLVVKVNDYAERRRIGEGSKAPRWATAYKFPAAEVVSTLNEVLWQVGRTGVITPRAVIEPVMVGGTTITYASLHNVDDIARKGFMLGDKVFVKRAGEVIPRVEAPAVHLRDGSQRPIEAPQTCPECGSPIDRSQARWRCTKGRGCQAVRVLTYAASRDILDLDGLGPKQVAVLVSAGITDLGALMGCDFSDLRAAGLGEAMSHKVADEIERARTTDQCRLIAALGIRGTGRSLSRALAKAFGSLDALRAATVDELAAVDKVGPIKAAQFVEELAELSGVIDAMREAGVDIDGSESDEATAVPADGTLAGMSVCVTGKMTGPLAAYGRSEMNDLIETHGGTAASSVSKTTDLLVANPEARGSSKGKNAVKHGVRIVDEAEFAAMLGM